MDDACLPHKTVSVENWLSPKGKKRGKLIKEKLHKDIVQSSSRDSSVVLVRRKDMALHASVED